ncbi:MAG: ABC transporter permease [Candidatus Krumholzibacteria bacterium]|jgi:ABC-type dipeptide/oligopeptide/nickel transport system permease subunit|nr:ABC transporter permease [Candidatus Krumholzibacteria bacterium]
MKWRRHGGFILGSILVSVFLLLGLFASLIPGLDPLSTSPEEALERPGPNHLFGTDALGRDLLARILEGARISLLVGVFSRGIALSLGTLAGLFAGYHGGIVDQILMRLADMTLSFPALLLLVAVVSSFGASLLVLFLALGFLGWAQVARVIRSRVLVLRSEEFVEAAVANGAGTARILFLHILPSCMAPLMVLFSMGMATAIIAEGSLSFLGLGAQAPQVSWGTLVRDGYEYIRTAPWLTFLPGMAMALAVLGFNLLGDALRDLLDPRGLPHRE